MKHALALAFTLTFATLSAQETIMLRKDTADVRVALHLEKAAICQETSAWWLAFGAAFTVLAADKSHRVYNENATVTIGAVTVAGFCAFQIRGAKHQRSAVRLMHQ